MGLDDWNTVQGFSLLQRKIISNVCIYPEGLRRAPGRALIFQKRKTIACGKHNPQVAQKLLFLCLSEAHVFPSAFAKWEKGTGDLFQISNSSEPQKRPKSVWGQEEFSQVGVSPVHMTHLTKHWLESCSACVLWPSSTELVSAFSV